MAMADRSGLSYRGPAASAQGVGKAKAGKGPRTKRQARRAQLARIESRKGGSR